MDASMVMTATKAKIFFSFFIVISPSRIFLLDYTSEMSLTVSRITCAPSG